MSIDDSLKIVIAFVLAQSLVSAFENFFATKGVHFETILNKSSFFEEEQNIEFSVSLDEKPDMPTWLRFYQDDPSADAVLYGTPDDQAYTVGLSIVAWNKETYETAQRVILLSVLETTPNVTYKVEFKLSGNPSSLIGNLQPFLKMIDAVWKGSNHISYVEDCSKRESKLSQGLFVGISGSEKYSDWMRELIGNSASHNCDRWQNKIIAMFSDANFNIDWCSVTDVTNQRRSENNQEFRFDEQCDYFGTVLQTTKWDSAINDLTNDIVYVFIAVIVGLVFIAFITSLMFCHREGLQNNLSSKQQLIHHKALRRVGAELRNMSSGIADEANCFPYGKLDEDMGFGTFSSGDLSSQSKASQSPPQYRHQDSRL